MVLLSMLSSQHLVSSPYFCGEVLSQVFGCRTGKSTAYFNVI